MPHNRYVLQKEKWMQRALYSLFNKEYKAFIGILRKQDTQKGFYNDMEVLLGRLRDWVVEILKERVQVVVKRGAEQNIQKYNPWFAIDFNLANSEASKYLTTIEQLHLSENQGSIYKTTKEDILEIVNEGITEGLSYGQMADKIQKTQPFVFSKARAELIAITEIGRAYEFGNWLPMKDLERQGATVMKEWITAGDEKVRPSHTQNARDGLIPLNQLFSGTRDLYAPAKNRDPFRCRCATWYKVL